MPVATTWDPVAVMAHCRAVTARVEAWWTHADCFDRPSRKRVDIARAEQEIADASLARDAERLGQALAVWERAMTGQRAAEPFVARADPTT